MQNLQVEREQYAPHREHDDYGQEKQASESWVAAGDGDCERSLSPRSSILIDLAVDITFSTVKVGCACCLLQTFVLATTDQTVPQYVIMHVPVRSVLI